MLSSSGAQLGHCSQCCTPPQEEDTDKLGKFNNIIGAIESSKGLINKEIFEASNYVLLGKVTTTRDRISVCILREDKYHRWVILMCSDSRESLNKRRSLCGYQKTFLHLVH